MARPYGDQTDSNRCHDVRPRACELAIADEVQRLQSEGRERREAAAEADNQQLPPRRSVKHRRQNANEEASEDVHRQRPPGEPPVADVR